MFLTFPNSNVSIKIAALSWGQLVVSVSAKSCWMRSSCPFLSKMAAFRSASLCPTKQTQMDSGTRVKQKANFYKYSTSQLSVVMLMLTLYFVHILLWTALNMCLKVLSSHLNWGARLDSFDPLLNSRWPAIKNFFFNETIPREELKTE